MAEYIEKFCGNGIFNLLNFNTFAPKQLNKDNVSLQMQKLKTQLHEALAKLYEQKSKGIIIFLHSLDDICKQDILNGFFGEFHPMFMHIQTYRFEHVEDEDFKMIKQSIYPHGESTVFCEGYYESLCQCIVNNKKQDFETLAKSIQAFESQLNENGYTVIKLFLNTSKEKEKERLIDALQKNTKQWQVSEDVILKRELRNDYVVATVQMIKATASECNPWYVVPSDNKWFIKYALSILLMGSAKKLHSKQPELNFKRRLQLPIFLERLTREVTHETQL